MRPKKTDAMTALAKVRKKILAAKTDYAMEAAISQLEDVAHPLLVRLLAR